MTIAATWWARKQDGTLIDSSLVAVDARHYAGAQAAGVPLRFTGQWQDANWYRYSGQFDLSYNVHRWYEGQAGRYTRPDPLGLGIESNVYVYVAGRPTLYFDPMGLAKVTNRSCRAIVIKTEGGNNLIRTLKPGESGNADGFFNGAADSCNQFCDAGEGDVAYKINSRTDVTITGGCGNDCLSWKTDDVGSLLWNSLDFRRVMGAGPGWKDSSWYDEHKDWVPPTDTRPKRCCSEPQTQQG
jgi:RHS repeat-associated protein